MLLFAQQGIRAVKMDDIATSLAISKRTLYELFDDKETLLAVGLQKYQRLHQEQKFEVIRQSANVMEVILKFYEMHLEESRVVNPLFYSDLEKYPAILDMLRREQQNQMDSFLDFMMRGVEEGYFRKGVNYKLIGHMFEALTKYMMEKRLYEAYSIEELYSNMLFVTLRGFCTEKGVRVLDEKIHFT